MKKSQSLFFGVSLLLLYSISACHTTDLFTKEEIQVIEQDSTQLMRIYTIDNPDDTATLRAKSRELSVKEMSSDYYKLLSRRMIQTVSDSTIDGVGIAAPQVGINRRVIAVQRFDKPDSPFEVFANIQIKEYSKDTTFEEEGCLSVPNQTAKAIRSEWVVISYTNPLTLSLQEDTVKGFTSIIFQHEIDHLHGILYTDSIRGGTFNQ